VASLPHLALAMLDHPGASLRVCAEWRRAAIYYVSLTGPSTGRIRSMPVTGDALVRYSLAPEDLCALATGLRSLCRLLLTAGAIELFPSIAGLDSLRTMDDLDRLPAALPAGRASVMAIHLFGSCPMGGSPARAAVDSWGRVWDAPGLRVNDASLLCEAPGVNPQGGIMAFAHRNALAYLAEIRAS
jgi:choline dehydrogenase-like flavoprotein